MIAVVFDFDGTLSVHQALPNKDPIETFGGCERALRVAAFLKRLRASADLFICSANNDEVIKDTLDMLGRMGVYIKGKWFKKIVGRMPPDGKSEFINGLPHGHIVFVDDNAEAFDNLDHSRVEPIQSSARGMTIEDEFRIQTSVSRFMETSPPHSPIIHCKICEMIKR